MSIDATAIAFTPYEQRLKDDRSWGMEEGSLHFEGKSGVHRTLRKIATALDGLGIPYAVAGGMALFVHGHERFTVDVDILVTAEGLRAIHEQLNGLGYRPPFEGSKQFRDTETGVRIEFLVAGGYPGDGKPKPVRFREPDEVATIIDGVRYVALPAFIEMKLASGMTGGVSRLKDLADVVALIETLGLTEAFAERLDPYVRPKFLELVRGLAEGPTS